MAQNDNWADNFNLCQASLAHPHLNQIKHALETGTANRNRPIDQTQQIKGKYDDAIRPLFHE